MHDVPDDLRMAIRSVPAGRWAVGVSGGADSVALLSLLRSRTDLIVHVAHLDHQTRQGVSAQDAKFVDALCENWKVPCSMTTLDQIEQGTSQPLANRSARFRAARLKWFMQIVKEYELQGVILAHHADDQAETVFLRLSRGAGYTGLCGISRRSIIGDLTILRPLLAVRSARLRDYLQSISQPWREDQSNQNPEYARNRVRVMLRRSPPQLTESMLDLAKACKSLRRWSQSQVISEMQLDAVRLSHAPPILARETARRWLVSHGAPPNDLGANVLDSLVLMASDYASPARRHFPGGVLVRRRRGMLMVDPR